MRGGFRVKIGFERQGGTDWQPRLTSFTTTRTDRPEDGSGVGGQEESVLLPT